MGVLVLQRVQWAGTKNEAISYNFVHLSIQEMLAAYRISQMGSNQQVRVFQTVLCKPRFVAVLQFYAGLTKLTNRGVRNIITGSDFTNDKSSQLSLLSYVRCFFEAQILDQSFYTKISQRLNGSLILSGITLSPLDCMSVGYFLAFVLRNDRELSLILVNCGINSHLIGLMMGELSKRACAEGALQGVTELSIDNNKIGDNGIALIATALQTNTTMTELSISGCGISDEGAESLAKAIAVNSSIQYLTLSWSSTHPDSTLKKIGEYLRTSMLYRLDLVMNMPSCEAPVTEERAKEWLQCVEVGGKELIQSLEDSHYFSNLRYLRLLPDYQTRNGMKQFIRALRATATAVNTARRRKGLHYVDIWLMYIM